MRIQPVWWMLSVVFCSTLLAAQGDRNEMTVRGQVIGVYKDPKSFVRVQLVGPGHYTALTDTHGQFSLKILPGQYLIRVIQGNNVQRSSMTINTETQNVLTVVVNW